MTQQHSPDDGRFFYYDPETGFHFFTTKAERDEAAKEAIENCLDDGLWFDEVTDIFAGVCTHITEKIVLASKPDNYDDMDAGEQGDAWPHGPDVDEILDYKLTPLPGPDDLPDGSDY